MNDREKLLEVAKRINEKCASTSLSNHA